MSNCTNCRLPINTDTDDSDPLCDPCRRLGKAKPSIRVSPLDRDDLELVFAWRSNPEIYQHFRQQDRPLEWDEHVTWFETRPASRFDYIIHYEGRRVGVVNIDQYNEIGVYLGDFSARGKGIATSALNWICDRFKDRDQLFAEIHKENDKSKRLFRRCGFRQEGNDEEWLRYVYEL